MYSQANHPLFYHHFTVSLASAGATRTKFFRFIILRIQWFGYPGALYCHMFLLYFLKMQPELNKKVNFKEAKASKKLWHGEVARLDDVTFPVVGKDVISPPPIFELKGQSKLAFMHTCPRILDIYVCAPILILMKQHTWYDMVYGVVLGYTMSEQNITAFYGSH